MAYVPGTDLPDDLDGTPQDDLIDALGGDDQLNGFDGNDTLLGGAGDDTLNGGSGDDVLDGGSGENFYYGGSGNDQVSFADATAGLTLSLADATLSTGDAAGSVFFSVEHLTLTAFDDRFIGTINAETVLGGAGNDDLAGTGGSDWFDGGDGDDDLTTGAGNSQLYGGSGKDELTTGLGENQLYGGSGDDRLWAVDGNDSLDGGSGNDLLDGGLGSDLLTGGAGDDTLIGGAGADVLDGGAGRRDTASYQTSGPVQLNFQTMVFGGDALGDSLINIERLRLSSGGDTVTLGGQVHWVDGGYGSDTLVGSDMADTLSGNYSDDFLYGGAGDDLLLGGDDRDLLIGGAGADTLDGGAGGDIVRYDTLVTLNLRDTALSTGEALGDVLRGIEAVQLSVAGSVYIGNAGDRTVSALTTGIAAFAGAGAETFWNVDSVDYGAMKQGVTLAVHRDLDFGDPEGGLVGSGAAAGDLLYNVGTVLLTNHADTLILDNSDWGEIGYDPIFAPTANLRGGADLLVVDWIVTGDFTLGSGADTVRGTMSNGRIDLGAGDDHLYLVTPPTTSHSVEIFGGSGQDHIELYGRRDSQSVSAGGGNDTITGSVYSGHYQGGDGQDVITLECRVGYSVATDIILMEGGAGADTLTATTTATGADRGIGLHFNGGAGNDKVTGVTYAATRVHDYFEFTSAWGRDQVTGFDIHQDHLVFDAAGLGLQSADDLVITGDASSTTLRFAGQSVTLLGVALTSFDLADVLIL